MRCHDDSAVWLPLHNVAQNLALRCHIEGACRLVKQQNRSSRKDSAGNRESLSLAGRETASALTHGGIKTAGLGGDEVPGTGHLQSLNKLLVGRVLPDHAEILGNRSGQDGISLRDISEKIARVGVGIYLLISGFNGYMTFFRADQSEYKTDHSGLSLAGRTNERNNFTRIGYKIGICDDLLAFQIGKIHVAQSDSKALVSISVHLAAFRDVDFFGQFDQLANAVGRDRTLQECWYNPDDTAEGVGQG